MYIHSNKHNETMLTLVSGKYCMPIIPHNGIVKNNLKRLPTFICLIILNGNKFTYGLNLISVHSGILALFSTSFKTH